METVVAIAIIMSGVGAAPVVQYSEIIGTLDQCRAVLEDKPVAPGVKVYCVRIPRDRGCRFGPCGLNFALPLDQPSSE